MPVRQESTQAGGYTLTVALLLIETVDDLPVAFNNLARGAGGLHEDGNTPLGQLSIEDEHIDALQSNEYPVEASSTQVFAS